MCDFFIGHQATITTIFQSRTRDSLSRPQQIPRKIAADIGRSTVKFEAVSN